MIFTWPNQIHWLFFIQQRLSNGSIDPDDDVNRVIELQDTLEKQNKELGLTKDKMMQLNLRIAELEENLALSQKEVLKSQESATKFQRDLKEVNKYCDIKNILKLFNNTHVFEPNISEKPLSVLSRW